MPVNRNALIRYRTLDNCLRNRFRKWTLKDLIDACSDALYEYEGIDKGVSRRTVQMDLQMMRSDKLGYNAPIIVKDRKYYSYEDNDYSITNIPLTDQDLNKLTEVTQILKQFKGFTHFQDISGMVNRLEDKIHTAKSHREPIIDFEKNEYLKGLEFIDPLYTAIMQKQTVCITYKSFKARQSQEVIFYPYLLKEYRNRWFVLGNRRKGKLTLLMALDRVLKVETLKSEPYYPPAFNVQDYFRNVIGVTVNAGNTSEEVVLFVENTNAPYVLTKPFHRSQKLLEKVKHGIYIQLEVQLNFELEREILGFGSSITVIKPDSLRKRINGNLRNALDKYNSEVNPARLQNSLRRLSKNGFDIFNNVYTEREINLIKKIIGTYLREKTDQNADFNMISIRQLLLTLPDLKPLLFNKNLEDIIQKLAPGAILTKAIYFDKPHLSNWFVTWHQDITINVKERKDVKNYSGWTDKKGFYAVCPPEDMLRQTLSVRIHLDTSDESNGALKIVRGSHHKRLKDEEIQTITQNISPTICEVNKGGIQLMKPLLLHSSSKSRSKRSRRVIHLEFCSAKLPEELQWSETLSD